MLLAATRSVSVRPSSSKPKACALLAQRLLAEVEAELGEGGVARDPQRVGERRGPPVAAAARRRSCAAARWSAAGRSSSGAGTRVSGVEPGLEGGGRGDDLEGGAGRVGLADRPVEQRVAGVGVLQRRPVVADRGRVERRQPGRVVRRGARHRQHRAGARLERDHRARAGRPAPPRPPAGRPAARVRTTSPPRASWPVSWSDSRETNSCGSSPDSTRSWLSSTASWP